MTSINNNSQHTLRWVRWREWEKESEEGRKTGRRAESCCVFCRPVLLDALPHLWDNANCIGVCVENNPYHD